MDKETVIQYFNFLSHLPSNTPLKENTHIYTVAWLREPGSAGKNVVGAVPGFGTQFGKLTELFNQYEGCKLALKSRGEGGLIGDFSLHTTLNVTGFGGRKKKDIESVRVFCVDIDTPLEPDDIKALRDTFKPHLIVESSPWKYHLYWRCRDFDLDTWEKVQLGLAWGLEGDLELIYRTGTIRVPGIERYTKAGEKFTPRIVYRTGERDVISNIYELELYFPKVWQWYEQGKAGREQALKAQREAARKLLKGKTSTDIKDLAHVSDLGRNQALYSVLKRVGISFFESRGKCSEDELTVFMEAKGSELNKSFQRPLDESEVTDIIKKLARKIPDWVEWKQEQKKLEEEKAKRESIELLVKEPEKEQGAVSPEERAKVPKEGYTNGHVNGHNHSKFSVIEGYSSDDRIPHHLKDAAKLFVERLKEDSRVWQKGVKAWNASLELKNYQAIADWICNNWSLIGSFRLQGPSVCLVGTSRWESPVSEWKHLDKEEFLAFTERVVTLLSLVFGEETDEEQRLDTEKDRKQGRSKNKKRDASYKGENPAGRESSRREGDSDSAATEGRNSSRERSGKPGGSKAVSSRLCREISNVIWKSTLTYPRVERQRDEVIVFQNGVLDTRMLNFTLDASAPRVNSHPTHSTFEIDIAKSWLEANASDTHWRAKMELLKAYCPKWCKYVGEWFPEDVGVHAFLLRWFGYSMTTEIGRQKFCFFHGPTGAGKGSISQVLCGLVGAGNYASVEYKVLDGGFKAANMHDKLVLVIEEVEGSAKEHEYRLAALKRYTGGERVQVERKYQLPFEDFLVGKFILQSNVSLQYRDRGGAVKGRMLALGFEQSYREKAGSKVPSDDILSTEANKLATIGAMEWSLVRDIVGSPFGAESLPSSRALNIGKEEIAGGMDVIAYILRSYVMQKQGEDTYSSKSSLTRRGLIDFIRYVADAKGEDLTSAGFNAPHVRSRGHIPRALKESVELELRGPEEVWVTWDREEASGDVQDRGKRAKERGWLNLMLNISRIEKDYPEILEGSFWEDGGMEREYPGLMLELWKVGAIDKDIYRTVSQNYKYSV